MAYVGNVPAAAYTNTVKDTFSGDGSTVAFTLSLPTTTNNVRVVVENVIQDPTVAYGVSGTTLTFTSAPPSGTNNIYVVHLGPAVQTVQPPTQLSGNFTLTGDLTQTGDIDVTGTVEATSVRTATLSDAAGTGPATLTKQSAAKAWARTDGTGTPAIADSFNAASVTDNGVGDITVTYTSAFSVAPCSPAVGQMGNFAGMQQVLAASVSSVQVKVHDFNGNASDPVGHHVSSFGDLA